MVVGYSALTLLLSVCVHGPPMVYGGTWRPECCGPVQPGRLVVDRVVVVLGGCWLRVAPWHCWERWQGLVVVLGVSIVHVVLWCGPVRRMGWVACGPRLGWGVVLMELVGVPVVFRHRGAGVGGGGGVLMPLLGPRILALRERQPLCGMDFCRQRSLCGVRRAVLVQGRGAAVRRWRWPLGRVLLGVGSGALEVGWCDAAWSESRLGYSALLAGTLAGPLAGFGLLDLAVVGGRCSPQSPWGWEGAGVPAMHLSEAGLEAPDVGASVNPVDLCGGGFAGGG